jgi:hypothetical protein
MRIDLITSPHNSTIVNVTSISPADMVQSAPDTIWTVETTPAHGHVRHQEGDDVVDRERNQQKGKAEHGRSLPFFFPTICCFLNLPTICGLDGVRC